MALLWKEPFNLRHSMHLTYHTRWQRCIKCLKLQGSFRKRATNYRALLRKMTSKQKASDASSPPCTPYLLVMSDVLGVMYGYDAFSLNVIFRKRAVQLVALLRKETCNCVVWEAYGVGATDLYATVDCVTCDAIKCVSSWLIWFTRA